ncbi:MAG: bifunctional DNA-formamidopyrimidine glycosylase/DNA-(apurinic or apyrimidinic site) lyase [Patescibacteria group bacterium]
MPELPEVETIKRNLAPRILGKTISNVIVFSKKNFIGEKSDIINTRIQQVSRYGKVLVFKLINSLIRSQENIKYLNIHFKLTGQMLYAINKDDAVFENEIPFTKGNKMPANTTRIIINFDDNSALFFNDLRKFGWIKVSDQPLKPKGVDVLDKEFTVKYLAVILNKTRRPIKVLLMDQDLITGIGNIYTNDSLFLARIHPLRSSNSLNSNEIAKLHRCIIHEISKGINDQGSSGADEAFILPDGSRGGHQRNFLVYQREDELCLNCKTIIKRIKHNGRSSFFCPTCQK